MKRSGSNALCLVALLCVLGTADIRAQVSTSSSPVNAGGALSVGSIPAGPAGASVANINTALQAIQNGNFVQAEAALALNAHTQPATVQRELEMAHSLGALALEFHDSQSFPTAVLVAQRAFSHLDNTKPIWSAADNFTLSQASELAGVLYEVVLGNRTAAEGLYQKAVQSDPTNVSAAQRLRRMQTADQFMAGRPFPQ